MKRSSVTKILLSLMLYVSGQASALADQDQMTFAVLGNSISTYENYLPAGYAVYYATSRGYTKDLQVGDTWWMQLSRMSGMSFLCNSSWSGSRVTSQSDQSPISYFTSDTRINSLSRAGVPDAVVIAGGTNDWTSGGHPTPLGEYSTTVFDDSTTFRGAYTMLLYKIKKRYPHIKLICCSIFPRSQGVTVANAAGWTQADANASIEHIAKQFGGYYVDCTGVPFSSNWSYYTIDNLHPTAPGHKLLAECITKSLLQQGVISENLKQTAEADTAECLLDLSFDSKGIVNKGTFETTVGSAGAAATVYDKQNNTYYGCTKMDNTDYFYALYDADSKLGQAFNKSVTWETLVRLESVRDASNGGAITKFFSNQQDGGWTFYNTADNVTFAYLTQAGVYSIMKYEAADSIMVAGKFYHLVVTLDRPSHTMRFFVNGKLVATGTRVATDLRYPNCGTTLREKNLWIGLGADPGANTAGSTGENGAATTFVFARIYGNALTESAAEALYNDDVKRFTEPTKPNSNDLIMDAVFTPTGADNKALGATVPIERVGEPILAYNTDLNQYEAQFTGDKGQFFKYNIGATPAIMHQMADAYSVEVFTKAQSALPSASIRPVSFIDGYGSALHMNAKGNIAYGTITYGANAANAFSRFSWTWTGEGVLQDGYHHYVYTFDRKNGVSKLYIDGVEKGSRSFYFKQCGYYEWAPSDWLSIGGVPNSTYDAAAQGGKYPYIGSISSVRLWGKALSAKEAAALSKVVSASADTVIFNVGGYASVCLPFAFVVPEGVTVYKVSDEDATTVTLTPIASAGMAVPYATPVILAGTPRGQSVIKSVDQRTVDSVAVVGDNLLKGGFGATSIPAMSYFLAPNGKGMMKASSRHTLESFACWLSASSATRTRRAFKIVDPTGIRQVSADGSDDRGAFYDLQGRKVSHPVRGIYIRNGKKVFVK